MVEQVVVMVKCFMCGRIFGPMPEEAGRTWECDCEEAQAYLQVDCTEWRKDDATYADFIALLNGEPKVVRPGNGWRIVTREEA